MLRWFMNRRFWCQAHHPTLSSATRNAIAIILFSLLPTFQRSQTTRVKNRQCEAGAHLIYSRYGTHDSINRPSSPCESTVCVQRPVVTLNKIRISSSTAKIFYLFSTSAVFTFQHKIDDTDGCAKIRHRELGHAVVFREAWSCCLLYAFYHVSTGNSFEMIIVLSPRHGKNEPSLCAGIPNLISGINFLI